MARSYKARVPRCWTWSRAELGKWTKHRLHRMERRIWRQVLLLAEPEPSYLDYHRLAQMKIEVAFKGS